MVAGMGERLPEAEDDNRGDLEDVEHFEVGGCGGSALLAGDENVWMDGEEVLEAVVELRRCCCW